MHSGPAAGSPFRQPKGVWAVALACVVSFMGIGLVDPILPALAKQLRATPSTVELLFTSYLVVTAVAMLVTGWVSSRIGGKRTLVAGLVLIVAFSAAAGASGSIGGIIGFRAGWGLGNALFIATSLAVIIGAASGGFSGAIILYETALGIGIALGPLIGGELGAISWRGPFFGVTGLMTIALVATLLFVEATPRPAQPSRLTAPLRALRHRGLATMSVTALGYNWGFFTLLAFTPFPMHLGVHQLGYVFTGWGVLVAIFAIFVAPRAQARWGTPRCLYVNLACLSADLVVIAVFTSSQAALIVAVIVSGAFVGLNNTLTTQAVMLVSPVERPVASAAYGFVRFIGGGLAPYVASKLAAAVNVHLPFYVGAATVAAAIAVLASGHRFLEAAEIGADSGEEHQSVIEAGHAEVRHLAPIVVATDGTGQCDHVVRAAGDLARQTSSPVEIVHVVEADVASDDAIERDTPALASERLDRDLECLRATGISAHGHLLRVVGTHGQAGRRAAEFANDAGARTVVIGAPSDGPLAGAFDESFSVELLRHARCAIHVVAPLQHAALQHAPLPRSDR